AEIADRVVVMQKGRVVEQGPVRRIFENPQHPYTQRLLGAVLRIDRSKAAPAVSGKAPALLQVRHLRKWFPIEGGVLGVTVGYVKALRYLSLDIERGEVLGLVGESGSGKTTAGRAILRLIEPTSGEVTFDGTNVTALS